MDDRTKKKYNYIIFKLFKKYLVSKKGKEKLMIFTRCGRLKVQYFNGF